MDNPFSRGAFQGHLNTIAANRQGYSSGFRPGSQTLDSYKFDEDKRQFDLTLADTQQARKADALRQAMEFNEKKRQFDLSYGLENQQTDYSPTSSGGGGSGGGKSNNGELFTETVASMLDGQARHRKAMLAGEQRKPHSYNYYVNSAIKLAQQSGKPLSNAEIKDLVSQATNFNKADAEWQASQGKDSGIVEMGGKKYKYNPSTGKYEPV
jgi:hypothetical protein